MLAGNSLAGCKSQPPSWLKRQFRLSQKTSACCGNDSRGNRGDMADQKQIAKSRTAEKAVLCLPTGPTLSATKLWLCRSQVDFEAVSASETWCDILNSQGLASAAVTREIMRPSGWPSFAIACEILDKSQSITEAPNWGKKKNSSRFNSTHLLSASWSLKVTEHRQVTQTLKHLLSYSSLEGFKH